MHRLPTLERQESAKARGWLRLASGLATLLLGGQAAWAQGPPLPLARVVVVRDSITRLLATDLRPDTLRVRRLNILAFALRTNEAPHAQRLARQALTLAQHLGFQQGLVEAHFNLGYNYRVRSQYDSAIYHSQQALTLAIQTGNRYTQTRAYYNLARIYLEQGNYAAALGPSLDGLALARTLHNPRVELFQLVLAGRIELVLGEYTAARAYVVEARRLVPVAHDPLGTGGVYLALGDISRQQGQWLAARRYYVQNLASYGLVYNDRGLLPVELSIADMTDRLGHHLAARRTTTQLLHRARTTGTPEQIAQTALVLARTWLPAYPDSARYYASLSLLTAQPRHLRPEARDAALVLALTSNQLGQGHAAYRYQVVASAYADSLSGEDARRRLAAVQARAVRSRAHIQLDLLQQQVRLRSQQQELERLRYRQQVAGLAALIGLALALGIVLLGRYRRRTAHRLLELRTRIAADLHDEVGSMLTQITMQSTLVRDSDLAPAQQQAYLDQVVDASRRAARQLRDAVWSIDARHDSMDSLLQRLRDHAHEMLPPGLDIEFTIAPGIERLTVPLATRQTLYAIYQEALHNVVKHAHAQRVWVRVLAAGAQLELEVRDDGKEPIQPRPGGQGLRNMRMRAAAVGGTLLLGPATPGHGVSLLVRLPL
jgi:signal transduction histidine kinase